MRSNIEVESEHLSIRPLWSYMDGNRRRLIFILLLSSSAFLIAQSGELIAPRPDWGVPTYLSDYPLLEVDNYQSRTPFSSGPCRQIASAPGLSFTFSVADNEPIPATPSHPRSSGALSTSAVVYDTTTNTIAATLWSGVTIANGAYCGTWNGYLDTGDNPPTTAPSDHNYEVRVLHSNVKYIWDGIVGVTEPSLAGPNNWDSAGSFPAGMTFVRYSISSGDTSDWGIIANGYNEGTIAASVFNAHDDATRQESPDTLWPLNLALYSRNEFDFAATDGDVIYFGARGYDTQHANAVVGFTLTSTLPPLTQHVPVQLVQPQTDGSQLIGRVPLKSYGKAPWGNPYIFTSIDRQLPAPTGQQYFFKNAAAKLLLSNAAVPHQVNGVTKPEYFDNGIDFGPAIIGKSQVKDSEGRTETVNSYGQVLTGLAVQRKSASPGNLLAVAHGQMAPFTCFSQPTAGNTISIWDKKTGASLGVLILGNNRITKRLINPQKMIFDLRGTLWLIDGGQPAVDCSHPLHPLLGNRGAQGPDPIWKTYGSLLKVSLDGGTDPQHPAVIKQIDVVTQLPNDGPRLSNPVDVAMSPVTGHLFVADGGANQQVYEFDSSTLSLYSKTGKLGGYGPTSYNTGRTCNSSITNETLWLDYFAHGTGVSRPWISVDNEDKLWIGDYSTSRILRFQKVNGSYKFVGDSQKGRYFYDVTVPRNAPTRVFAGPQGMLEYQVDYPDPDPAAMEPPPAGNTAFSSIPVRNWMPCFLRSEWQNGGVPDTTARLYSVEHFNAETFGSIIYHSANPELVNRRPLLKLPESGQLEVRDILLSPKSGALPIASRPYFDPSGNLYASVIQAPCGPQSSPGTACEKFLQYQVTGLDTGGWPLWESKGRVLAEADLALQRGDALGMCFDRGCDFSPTINNIIPLYAGAKSRWFGYLKCQVTDRDCPAATVPAYHLGGVLVGGNKAQWHAELEANVEYPTLLNDPPGSDRPFAPPSRKVNNLGLYSKYVPRVGKQNMGVAVHSIDNSIFTLVNGNWQQFSCQFYHYTDDGMFVGQFGWRGDDASSVPSYQIAEALAPGYCGNPQTFSVVKVRRDYYVYVTDEGYRAGIQRWHIVNTDSIGIFKAATADTLRRQAIPLVLR